MTGLVINVPYASLAVPPPVARRLALSPEEWQAEHWRLSDPYLAEIAREAASFERRRIKIERPVLVYPFSPLVADPWGLWAAELAEEGSPPAAGPALLPRTTAGRPLDWPAKDMAIVLNRSVVPFQQAVAAAIRAALAETPLALSLTLRSFGSQPLDFEKSRRYPRPQAAIGSRPPLTPPGLAQLAGGVLKSCRWWPELNWPQSEGACLPAELAGHPRVLALGLSLRRDLYLDERSGRRKSAAAAGVTRVLRTLFNLLDQELERVGRLRLERARAPRGRPPRTPSPVIKKAAPETTA